VQQLQRRCTAMKLLLQKRGDSMLQAGEHAANLGHTGELQQQRIEELEAELLQLRTRFERHRGDDVELEAELERTKEQLRLTLAQKAEVTEELLDSLVQMAMEQESDKRADGYGARE